MAGLNKLFYWLISDEISKPEDGQYRHRIFKERPELRCEILGELKTFVQNAHEDARCHLRKPAEISIDPLDQTSAYDPSEGYPKRLHIQTLKGYFGEIFAGLIAENFSPFGYDWKVPAFLFRFHDVAFQTLERIRQTSEESRRVPGRTGDDCLAFQLGSEGRIIRSLVCEAKCTSDHRPNMISEAHVKLSETNLRPVDVRLLIDILEDYNDADSSRWVNSLSQLLLCEPRELGEPSSGYERCDLVSYICGRSPKQADRKAWMPTDRPHEKYKVKRRLEAAETHLSDVEGLVRAVYEKEDEENG